MKIVFWGTPTFSLPALQALLQDKIIKVLAVVTQPDKPQGRSKILIPSPVKKLALESGLKVFTPTNLKGENFTTQIKNLGAYDVNVVVAYGKLIPVWQITYPIYGSLNIHPSLLPLYRGPSPIQTAILHNDSETGVSIIVLDKEMDHGPIIRQEKLTIKPSDTYLSLEVKLAKLGAKILLNCLTKYAQGTIKAKEQNHSEATFCKLLTKNDGQIKFNKTAQEIFNKIRALNPWPGTYTTWQGKQLKIIKAKIALIKLPVGFVSWQNNQLSIGTATQALVIEELQLAGKTKLPAGEFIKGNKKIINQILPN